MGYANEKELVESIKEYYNIEDYALSSMSVDGNDNDITSLLDEFGY